MDLMSVFYCFVEDGLDCKVTFAFLKSSWPGHPMYECIVYVNDQRITTRDFVGEPGLNDAKLQLRDAIAFMTKS